MPNKRRKRKHRSSLTMTLTLLLFAMTLGYIIYILATQPERFSINANRRTILSMLESREKLNNESTEPNPFNQFNFYIADKQNEYESYQENRPYLHPEEVVWHINAGLHKNAFDEAAWLNEKNPILVNPYNRLPDDFVPLALELIDEHGRMATPETLRAFNKMRYDAAHAGHDLQVQSAYRNMEHQRDLYNRSIRDKAVAPPGFSEHHTGRALDLGKDGALLDINNVSDMGRWVRVNAHEYGFIIRYTAANQSVTGYIDEPWHITYVGEKIAKEMAANGYGSLEEYVAKNPGAMLDFVD